MLSNAFIQYLYSNEIKILHKRLQSTYLAKPHIIGCDSFIVHRRAGARILAYFQAGWGLFKYYLMPRKDAPSGEFSLLGHKIVR